MKLCIPLTILLLKKFAQVEPICGRHEIYSTCGSACEKSCDNLYDDIVCMAVCVEGCFCQEGYVRNEKGGTCVPKSECAQKDKDSDHEKKCVGAYQEYKTCGTACPRTCQMELTGAVNTCNKMCVKGCFCRSGYVLDEKRCISIAECLKQGQSGNSSTDPKNILAGDDLDGDSGNSENFGNTLEMATFWSIIVAYYLL